MANTKSLDLERGSSEHLAISDASQTGLDLTTDFTIEFWVNLESTGVLHRIINKDDGSTQRSYFAYISTAQKLVAGFWNGNTFPTNITQVQSNSAVISGAGVWTHIAVSFDISVPTAVIYVDGSSVASTMDYTNATTVVNSTAEFELGAATSGNTLDGKIDEVRVWNDIRTSGEISANYNKELVGNESGLVAYWKFNDSLLDITSNNNDLTHSGTPTYSTDVPFVGGFIPKLLLIQ